MSGDGIDRVIEEWEAQPGCSVSYGELGIAFGRGASMVAAWRRAGHKATLLGYLQTGADAPREAHVSELRVALGLPAWVAPPAPPRAVPPTYPITGSWTAEVAEESAQALTVAHKEQVERLLERAEQAEAQRDDARLRVGELEREAGRREREMEQVRRRSRSNAHALNTARVLVAEALRMMDAREELDEAKGRFARAHAAYREAEEVCDDEQP